MTTAEPGHCPVPRSSRNASTDLDRISGASSSRSSSRLTGGTLEENVAIRSLAASRCFARTRSRRDGIGLDIGSELPLERFDDTAGPAVGDRRGHWVGKDLLVPPLEAIDNGLRHGFS